LTRQIGAFNDYKGLFQGFTLAEVLITLGIIGVVAAMTIPVLIANHKKQEVVTKLEKVYTVMNQAIKMSEVENGAVEHWYMDCGISSSPTCSTEEVKDWFKNYLGKYLNITKIVTNDTSTGILIYFSDGSIINMPRYIYDIAYYTNEKAMKNPITGKNYFIFRFNPVLLQGQVADKNKYTVKSTFEPYSYSWDGTREGLTTTSNQYACSTAENSRRTLCTKLIQYEGWQIPKDYPIKF
jgi:prepilin-type cleavage/methylation N-terminal domain protein